MNTKRLLLVASAALVLLAVSPFNSNASNASNGGGKATTIVTPLTDGQLQVRYTGANQDGLLFNIQFENPTGQKFSLIIKNDEGEVLYQSQFNDVHFSKTVQFLRDEVNIHPTFIIRSGKQEVKHSFVINSTVVENIEVTKL